MKFYITMLLSLYLHVKGVFIFNFRFFNSVPYYIIRYYKKIIFTCVYFGYDDSPLHVSTKI